MIRYYTKPRVLTAPSRASVVHADGKRTTAADHQFWSAAPPEFICDTVEEAKKLRLLIEQRREEREALERKWELRLAEEVER